MESRAKAAGHAIHQQLVVFPLGLLSTAVVFDVIGLLANNGHFTSAAYLMIAAGVLMGLLAAIFGLIDFIAVPDGTRAKRIGRLHGAGNVVMIVLFAISWFMRGGAQDNVPSILAFVLELLAFVIAAGAGWLGGELVGRLGVGVDDGAGLDAPAKFTTGISLKHGPHQAGL
ncbi:putative membrane protein [Arthrobacter sp. V4I6]|uniref:DUF2231 domain-containing protein n=1 Tax=unclassified Arthrobacter TaxID=235627 RepID=UPI0027894F01|nr:MULTISPECIES: DUF2231 domain-containing protein [unclassified Arthrobacter]MDQ0821931.1 putative membrane protein [Arthrobacter sp. V1I7]MDQ0856197.1 putative membrane protein [Arthrobacter sp. V4I6]